MSILEKPEESDYTMENRLVELALIFAQVHIGDNDCLGVAARELFDLIKRDFPGLEAARDIDC